VILENQDKVRMTNPAQEVNVRPNTQRPASTPAALPKAHALAGHQGCAFIFHL
jgi:hypothetical protein